jgi:KDO2-lipid IV(A) lauroyltransferase
MDTLLYYAARVAIALVQVLPLHWAARLGRGGGVLAYWLDARHRKVALANLQACFGAGKSQAEIEDIARENFRRIGENFACAIKTASMSMEDLAPHIEFVGAEKVLAPTGKERPKRVVVAIGHFGNFELYARFNRCTEGYELATTYRGLRQPALDRLMQSLRERSGCHYFERRFDAGPLKEFMNRDGVILGLLADQHAGDRALRLPFLGRACFTSAAPAIFALRYHCVLTTGICYRVGLAKWRIEAGDEIPTLEAGQPRSTAAIMADVNRAFEEAVRRDPANWFWVHNRWKAPRVARSKPVEDTSRPAPDPASEP